MIKVSIIIPVYNGENYLDQCIRSVLRQTMMELEIICVDDGSTDSSPDIVRQIAIEDTRVILLQQKNQGAGMARNRGMQAASGRYIAFLDADDYYHDQNALELMVDICEEQGLSACASMYKYMIYDIEKKEELLPGADKNMILHYRDFQMDFDYTNYLFERKLLMENDIFFPAYRRFQDPPFLVRALYAADKFMLVDTCLYCCRVSDLNARFDTPKTADLIRGMIDNLVFASKQGLNTLFWNTADRLEYEYTSIIIRNIAANDMSILNLLLQANQVVAEQLGDLDYIIRPIRMLLYPMNQYEKKLLQKIDETNKLAIYGAGHFAKLFLLFLKKKNLLGKIENIVVSDLKGNQSEIEGIPVISFQQFSQERKMSLLIVVGGKIQREISDFLKQNNIDDFDVVEDVFLDMTVID